MRIVRSEFLILVYGRVATVKIMFSDMVKNLPEEVVLFVLSGYKSGKFVAVNFEQLVASCLEQPFELIQFGPKIDPITS